VIGEARGRDFVRKEGRERRGKKARAPSFLLSAAFLSRASTHLGRRAVDNTFALREYSRERRDEQHEEDEEEEKGRERSAAPPRRHFSVRRGFFVVFLLQKMGGRWPANTRRENQCVCEAV
jgi:hypothetical protein